MMHPGRRFSLSPVASAEELAQMLTDRTWTLCSGFCVTGKEAYLFLNDSTHEDGAGEFAIVKRLPEGGYLQIESVTFSWCTADQALLYVRRALAGEDDANDFALSVQVVVETPAQHRRCSLCA